MSTDLVDDPAVAETLEPYYRHLCKRPLFHDEYLAALNLDTVTLVDCPAGIERITPRGLVATGQEYDVDCIIYATGFEAEVTPFPRRAAHDIIGRDGVSIGDRWKDGPWTFHGIMTRGFPNLFLMPAPGQEAVITVNISHLYTEGAIHIAETIAALEACGAQRATRRRLRRRRSRLDAAHHRRLERQPRVHGRLHTVAPQLRKTPRSSQP